MGKGDTIEVCITHAAREPIYYSMQITDIKQGRDITVAEAREAFAAQYGTDPAFGVWMIERSDGRKIRMYDHETVLHYLGDLQAGKIVTVRGKADTIEVCITHATRKPIYYSMQITDNEQGRDITVAEAREAFAAQYGREPAFTEWMIEMSDGLMVTMYDHEKVLHYLGDLQGGTIKPREISEPDLREPFFTCPKRQRQRFKFPKLPKKERKKFVIEHGSVSAADTRWVIVTHWGEKIPMNDDWEIQDYRKQLQNSEILIERLPESTTINIVDEKGRRKENYILQFQNAELAPKTVGQERRRFANEFQSESERVTRWVILKSNGERIPMEDNHEIQFYKIHLQNSEILTLRHPESTIVNILDEQGQNKKNCILHFEDDALAPRTVGQERIKFAQTYGGVSAETRWVILKSSGERIPMDDNQEVQYYKPHLQNSELLTERLEEQLGSELAKKVQLSEEPQRVNYLKHAGDVWPSDSLMDSHLQQAVPLLQMYWNTVYEMTSKKLVLQSKSPLEPGLYQISQIKIDINVPMVVETYESEVAENLMGSASSQLLSNIEALFLIELLTIYIHKLQDMQELKCMPGLGGASSNEGEEEERTSKLESLKELNQSLADVLQKISDFQVAKLLGCTVVEPPGVIEQLKDLTEKVRRLKASQKQIQISDSSPFAKTNDWNLIISYEKFWCCILGFHGKPFNNLYEIDSDMQRHQHLSNYLESVIERKENRLKAKHNDYLRDMREDGLVTNLQRLGFTKGRAQVITESIQIDLIDLQLPSYWAAKYLDFAMLYHPLLNHPSQLPYKCVKENEWSTESVENKRERKVSDKASGSPKWPERPVQMINVTSEVGKKNVGKYLDELAVDSDYRLFYHKTCLIGAQSILQSGIKLGNGRKNQDFSSGDGFYLAEDFVMARGWRRNQVGFQAVVVFRVQQDLVDPAAENGLDVSNNKQMWEEIVRICRSDYDDALKKIELLNNVTFIRGQMCKNPKSLGAEQTSLKYLKIKERRMKYCPLQFCIRDEKYALRFGNIDNIAGVIFYDNPAQMEPSEILQEEDN